MCVREGTTLMTGKIYATRNLTCKPRNPLWFGLEGLHVIDEHQLLSPRTVVALNNGRDVEVEFGAKFLETATGDFRGRTHTRRRFHALSTAAALDTIENGEELGCVGLDILNTCLLHICNMNYIMLHCISHM